MVGQSQKLPVSSFKLFEDLSEFDKGFIKSDNEKSKNGYFLKVDVQYPKQLHESIIIYHFYQEE